MINGVNKVLITDKIAKLKENCNGFSKGLMQSFLEFNDPEAISKQLTSLIKS